MYQAASGAGYDQSCNGSMDVLTDVPPWLASSSDPFGGGGGENYDSSLADAGLRGGFGFREYSLPVIVYATDNYMRDADLVGTVSYGTTPGGCPIDAGAGDVISALSDIGGYIIGADVTGGGSSWGPGPQMLDLAQRAQNQGRRHIAGSA